MPIRNRAAKSANLREPTTRAAWQPEAAVTPRGRIFRAGLTCFKCQGENGAYEMRLSGMPSDVAPDCRKCSPAWLISGSRGDRNMTPDTENQEVKLAYGIRAGIREDRMEQIQLGLPYSMTLRDVLPYLADPFAGASSFQIDKMRARVRLSDGWHMLNQSRTALIEAEACKVFYEECQPNPVEARYRCRFYLDDAALRLHSSCEHLLWCVAAHWSLPLSVLHKNEKRSAWSVVKKIGLHVTRDLINVIRGTTRERRPPTLLVRVMNEAKRANPSDVPEGVANVLQRLQSSKSWRECVKYRNLWVHNRLPAVAGLHPEVLFDRVDHRKEFPPEVLKAFQDALGYPITNMRKMTVGVGQDIDKLRETVRDAYSELFRAYESLAKLLA